MGSHDGYLLDLGSWPHGTRSGPKKKKNLGRKCHFSNSEKNIVHDVFAVSSAMDLGVLLFFFFLNVLLVRTIKKICD